MFYISYFIWLLSHPLYMNKDSKRKGVFITFYDWGVITLRSCSGPRSSARVVTVAAGWRDSRGESQESTSTWHDQFLPPLLQALRWHCLTNTALNRHCMSHTRHWRSVVQKTRRKKSNKCIYQSSGELTTGKAAYSYTCHAHRQYYCRDIEEHTRTPTHSHIHKHRQWLRTWSIICHVWLRRNVI